MKLFVVGMFVFVATTAPAAGLPCTMHPKRGTPAADLPALAKVSREDAEKIALGAIKAPDTARITEGGLEIEHGCLVYSFDIRVPGRSGIEEVIIDPVNGSVLARSHESARQEAAEQAKDKASQRRHQ
jgi:hypothetical protein